MERPRSESYVWRFTSTSLLGRFDDGEFDVAQQLIIGSDEREIHVDALVHRRIGTALGAPLTVGRVGDLVADGGPVRLARGGVRGRRRRSRARVARLWAG